MRHLLIPSLIWIGVTSAACTDRRTQTGVSGQPGFRVRSDFGAALNSDQGWAGALNENVTVNADQPFRLRFEVERPAESTGSRQFRLQYRRDQGDWTDVEAHDFPHPERALVLDFAKAEAGAISEGWRVAQGDAAGLTAVADGPGKVLRAKADRVPLIALYPPPWELKEFTFGTEIRLPTDSRSGAGLVFGYVDAGNFCRVFLDPAAGAIRVSRVVNGKETVVADRKAGIVAGRWLEVEIQYESGELEVSFGDGAAEFKTGLGTDIPPSHLGLQVPAGNTAEFRSFSIEGEPRTPRVSIVACAAFANGAATTDLLKGSAAGFHVGAGISLAEQTPPWAGAGSHGEFEWALVVRRFADGAATNEQGDTFELRMVEAGGIPNPNLQNPVLRLAVPPGHVGGTFVETPGRIGPWQASNGDLYFIMEPAETDNVFMMIKSSDNGLTWREADAANRPATNDLESVDTQQVGDTIHIIHQVTRTTRYHSFRTSDHPTHPDTWAVRDELAATVNSVAQAAALAVRSDGSVVAFHVGQTIHYSIRSAAGKWSADRVIDSGAPPSLAGPKAVAGANDVIHLAYYGMDGTVWYRRLLPDGTLTQRHRLASGLGTSRKEYGAVLPLVFIPKTNTVVILYRVADGKLWEQRVVNDGAPTPPVRVTDRMVIQDAVDSQQPGADAVQDGETVHVLFIEESSRSIFSTHDKNGWQPSKLQVDRILGSWVRGNVYTRKDGARVYGYIYDAGSDGGAGMNRFAELVLAGP